VQRNGEAARSRVLPDGGLRRPRLGKPVELGQARPLSATARGVVVRVGRDSAAGWVLDGTTAPSGTPGTAPSGEQDPFWGPAPGVARDSAAFWVSQGQAVRAPVAWRAGGPGSAAAPPATSSHVLATDAVNGTRVSAATVTLPSGVQRDAAGYIARPAHAGGDMRARLWVEGSGLSDLSPDGAGASTVALRAVDDRLIAVSMDARSAMSPLHARWIRVSAERGAVLEPDVVVFVGPPPESRTDPAVAIGPDGPVAIVPLPKDATHFGLAVIAIGWEPVVESEPAWTLFPNGIDPAPVDAAEICDEPFAVYARPADAAAGARCVVALAPVIGKQLGPEQVVAEGAHVGAVGIAARGGASSGAAGGGTAATAGGGTRGGIVAWTADGRTFARTVECP
jgi:hypothetical protein